MSDVGTVDYWKAKYEEEYEIVDRVWRALGISCYEDAKGKTIDQLVKELREKCTPPEAASVAWISVNDRLPAHGEGDVVALRKDGGAEIVTADVLCREIYGAGSWAMTHWIPLPELPPREDA